MDLNIKLKSLLIKICQIKSNILSFIFKFNWSNKKKDIFWKKLVIYYFFTDLLESIKYLIFNLNLCLKYKKELFTVFDLPFAFIRSTVPLFIVAFLVLTFPIKIQNIWTNLYQSGKNWKKCKKLMFKKKMLRNHFSNLILYQLSWTSLYGLKKEDTFRSLTLKS